MVVCDAATLGFGGARVVGDTVSDLRKRVRYSMSGTICRGRLNWEVCTDELSNFGLFSYISGVLLYIVIRLPCRGFPLKWTEFLANLFIAISSLCVYHLLGRPRASVRIVSSLWIPVLALVDLSYMAPEVLSYRKR